MRNDKKPLTSAELAKRVKQEYGSSYSAMAALAFWSQFVKNGQQQSRPTSTPATEWMIANLKIGIKLDHIRYVEHGIRPMDDNYRKFKQEMVKLYGPESFHSIMEEK